MGSTSTVRCHICRGPHWSWACHHLIVSRTRSQVPTRHYPSKLTPPLPPLMTLKTTPTQSLLDLFVKESLLPSRTLSYTHPVSTPVASPHQAIRPPATSPSAFMTIGTQTSARADATTQTPKPGKALTGMFRDWGCQTGGSLDNGTDPPSSPHYDPAPDKSTSSSPPACATCQSAAVTTNPAVPSPAVPSPALFPPAIPTNSAPSSPTPLYVRLPPILSHH